MSHGRSKAREEADAGGNRWHVNAEVRAFLCLHRVVLKFRIRMCASELQTGNAVRAVVNWNELFRNKTDIRKSVCSWKLKYNKYRKS